jgi:hypothetical protein
MDALSIVFPLATGVAFVSTCCLLALAVRSALPTTPAEERRFRAFAHIRIATYASLALVQAVLISARAWEHWPAVVTAVDADGALVEALYLITLVR